ncbi:hypothetical protein D3C79_868730 [compost metagenome]
MPWRSRKMARSCSSPPQALATVPSPSSSGTPAAYAVARLRAKRASAACPSSRPNTGRRSTWQDIHRRAGACCRYSWRIPKATTSRVINSSGPWRPSPVDKPMTHCVNAGNAASKPANRLSKRGITSSNSTADTPRPVSNSSRGYSIALRTRLSSAWRCSSMPASCSSCRSSVPDCSPTRTRLQ